MVYIRRFKQRQRHKADGTFICRRGLFEESLIVQLGSAFLALFFVHRTVRFLASGIAIFDQLATIARFETIAALAATGAFFIGRAH